MPIDEPDAGRPGPVGFHPLMTTAAPPALAWYRELNRYHWWILAVCSMGWLFDTMDQRLFVLARAKAMEELVGGGDAAAQMGRLATTIFILGWATGGIVFGILGDKWGRAKTMMLTILVYAIFTGLSGLSRSAVDFMIYRFLAGLGVGGEFSAGVALVAEVIPERPRPYALGILQGLSAVGNILGATLGYFILPIGWRQLFFVGILPALLVVVIRRRLKEPESWVRAKAEAAAGRRMGSYADLFGQARWRRNALVGATLAIVGVTGLWGMGFYSPELVGLVLKDQGLDEGAISRQKAVMALWQDVGAFFSMYGFAVVSARIGRKATFHLACLLGMVSIIAVFGLLGRPGQVMPFGFLLGFGTLALFGGYAVYFPEIFPTRLRATGVSFCYNVGRYAAAGINLLPIYVHQLFAGRMETVGAYRATAITMALLYLIGNAVVFFAPETKGQPLPTEEESSGAPAGG